MTDRRQGGPLEGSTAAGAENALFEEGAIQGISIAAAAGDAGAQDCEFSLEVADESLPVAAVDDPASQPFVTGVGGTSMSAIGNPPTTRPTEVVWDTGTGSVVLGATGQVVDGAGGGGVSEFWQMPGYQADAPAALNTINAESSDETCSSLEGDCREVLDVSADAVYYSGYVEYWDGGWTVVGGTSGAAPLWAAMFADADSNTACSSKGGIGFANPDLYDVAGSSTANYAADFNDITSGDNDLQGTNGGEFEAMTGYDMASGLGTPVAANLVPALCNASTLTTAPASGAGSASTTTTTVTNPGATSTATVTSPATTTTKTGPTIVKVHTTSTVVTAPGRTATKGASCKLPKRLSFVQHPAYPVRETKAIVYVNGKRTRTVTGKRIVDVVITRPQARTFTLKLVTTLSSAEVISHQITYNGCTASKVVTKVLHKAV